MEINTIITPVDFSDVSQQSLRFAFLIAEKINARLILYHLYGLERSFYEDEPQNYLRTVAKDIKTESLERLRDLAIAVRKSSKVKLEYLAEEGEFPEGFISLIEQQKADMVIMATKGAEDIRNYISGSNAEEVLGKAKCPVLIVPEKSGTNEIKKIVYATDYSLNDITPVKFLALLSEKLSAQLILLHVAHGEIDEEENRLNEYKKVISKNLRARNLKFDVLHRSNNMDALDEYCIENNVGLLGINHRIRTNFIDKFLNPSLSEDLTLFSRTPVFIFPHYND